VAFLIASVILAVTPGPGVLYIVTRSLTQSRRFGLASVAGVALGNLGNAVGASIGLAAVFAAFLPQVMTPAAPSSASGSTR
jgi:threonine/homoserine/homoserine lactone efflux protein